MALATKPTQLESSLGTDTLYRGGSSNEPFSLSKLERKNIVLIECSSLAEADREVKSLSSSEAVVVKTNKNSAYTYGDRSLYNSEKVYFTSL